MSGHRPRHGRSHRTLRDRDGRLPPPPGREPDIRVWITCEAPGKAEIDVTVEQHIAGTNATRWAGINPNGPWFDCSTTSTLLRPSWDGCGCPEGHTYVRGWAVVRVIDWSSFYGPYAGVWQRSILLRRS